MDAAVTAADTRTAAPPTHRALASGRRVPAIGVGTFGSDRYDAETVGLAVEYSLRADFRLPRSRRGGWRAVAVPPKVVAVGTPVRRLLASGPTAADAHPPTLQKLR